MNVQATRAVERFRCIAADCEDNCCNHTWTVPYDKTHYEKLAQLVPTDALLRNLRVNPEAKSADDYATIHRNADGACGFFSDGLCEVHARFGDAPLGDACATYPRPVVRSRGRLEQIGHISCPELARLMLLTDDGLELVALPCETNDRPIVDHAAPPDPEDLFQSASHAVTERIKVLLTGDESLPLASRLYSLAFLGDRTRTILRVGSPLRAGNELNRILDAMGQPKLLQQLHESVVAFEPPWPFAIAVVRELLLKPPSNRSNAMRALLEEIASTYAMVRQGADVPIEELFFAVRRGRPALSPRLERRLDQLLTRFALHTVLENSYINAPSLMHYAMLLLTRVAIVRFLILAHPLLQRDGSRDDEATERALDALVVRATYLVARELDHRPELTNLFVADLEAQGLTGMAHASCLAKL